MPLAYQEHYTVRDYANWQGDWELIQGAPYAMSPSPSISHQFCNGELYFQIKQALKTCEACHVLFEVDWEICDDTVVRPDVLIACNLQGEKLTKTPEMIVEVVSPTSAKRDEQVKFELYQREGVQTYMLVYPENQVAKVYVLKEGYYIKAGDFTNESFFFQVKGCGIEINFNQVWRQPD